MKKPVHILLSTITLSVLFLNTVDAFTFTRPLKVLSTGEDVLQLQKILNSNPQTQISSLGVGSPGNETTFFGLLTQSAVIKFQNLYAKQILTPVGLTQGTGFVGQSTLNFLNSMNTSNMTNQPSSSTNTTQPQSVTNTSQSSTPLFQPLMLASHPDTEVSVISTFDLSDTDFFLNDEKLSKECKVSEYMCEVSIDAKTKPDTYTLSTSNPILGTHQFTVIDEDIRYPEVSIDSIKLNTDVVIKGKYFTPKMKVSTIYGEYETATADNSFILKIQTPVGVEQATMPGGFYVENEYGLQSETIIINYEK